MWYANKGVKDCSTCPNLVLVAPTHLPWRKEDVVGVMEPSHRAPETSSGCSVLVPVAPPNLGQSTTHPPPHGADHQDSKGLAKVKPNRTQHKNYA
eukprot:4144340-Amphidinium_carterae.3